MKHSSPQSDGANPSNQMVQDRRSTLRYSVNEQVCCVINRYQDIVCQVINVSINGITITFPMPKTPIELNRFTIDLYSSENGYFAKNVLCEKTFDRYDPMIKMFYCVPIKTVGVRFVNLTVGQLKRIEHFKRQTTIGLTRDRRSGFDRRDHIDRRQHIPLNKMRPDRRNTVDRRKEEERRQFTFGVKVIFSPN